MCRFSSRSRSARNGGSRWALYATLDRLESKRLLHSWLADPTPQRGGRSKRYFRVLPEGMAALTESKAALDRMWQGLRLKGESRG